MRLSFSVYLAVVLLAAGYVGRHPEYNWDLIPYAAIVVQPQTQDAAALHAQTYRLVRDAVPPLRMRELVASGYEQDIAASPDLLVQQLPFYRIRPLYLLALRACTLVAASPVRATIYVSLAAYLALCLLVWAWLRDLAPLLRCAVASLIAISQPLLHVAGLSNPDALLAAVVVLAFYLFVVHERAGAALALLCASVLIRSDNVFLCALFAGYLGWRNRHAGRTRWLVPAGAALAGIVWVAWWHHTVGNYGWRLTLYHSFIMPLSNPAAGAPHMTAAQLAKLWIGGLASLRQSSLPLCALLLVCALALRQRFSARPVARDAAAVVSLAMAAHVLVFPNLEDRFFVAHLVILTLLATSQLLDGVRLQARTPAQQPLTVVQRTSAAG
jgi:hypothetical protein